jgi:tetraacyldisaccharide 4'-kinase
LGGTGKTPLAISILKKLQNNGVKIGVLSRGYKRKSNEEIIFKSNDLQNDSIHESIGDEPTLILENLTNGILGIGADRHKVGKKILQESDVDLFLLDDGLQHRKLNRDLDICLIDVSRWQQHPFLFPFSYLRDSKSSFKRCHAIILTKIGNQKTKAEKLKNRIKGKYNIPVFEGDLKPQALINIKNKTEISLAELTGRRVVAFCGIANPVHFFSMMNQAGVDVVLEKIFPDHFHYNFEDIQQLENTIKDSDINTVFTTEKDAVKLKSLIPENFPYEIYYLKVEFEIKEMDKFNKLFTGLLSSKNFVQY